MQQLKLHAWLHANCFMKSAHHFVINGPNVGKNSMIFKNYSRVFVDLFSEMWEFGLLLEENWPIQLPGLIIQILHCQSCSHIHAHRGSTCEGSAAFWVVPVWGGVTERNGCILRGGQVGLAVTLRYSYPKERQENGTYHCGACGKCIVKYS